MKTENKCTKCGTKLYQFEIDAGKCVGCTIAERYEKE